MIMIRHFKCNFKDSAFIYGNNLGVEAKVIIKKRMSKFSLLLCQNESLAYFIYIIDDLDTECF